MPLTREIHGLVITDHEFSLPLDHASPSGEKIAVFAREVAASDGRDRPFLVFLQGGPGSEAPRPTTPKTPGWMERALKDYRVLFLDQRGTGRSTPVGMLEGMTPQEQYAYLVHFRADAIVRDAEVIREELGVDKWSVLGQSFGGFCVTTYLSFFPGGLTEAFLTGGLPPVARPTEEVYRATYVTRARTQSPLLRAVSRGSPEGEGAARAPRLRGGALAVGGRADVAALPAARHGARDERRRRAAPLPPRFPCGFARVPLRRREPDVVRAEPAVRRPCTSRVTPTAV